MSLGTSTGLTYADSGSMLLNIPENQPKELSNETTDHSQVNLAQNDQVLSDAYDATGFRNAAEEARTELQNRADRSFQLELRRSPVDGTFRPTKQWLEDWNAFNTALPRQSRTAGNTPGTEGGGSAPQRPVIYDAEDHTQRVLDAIRRITEDRPDTSRPTSGSEDLFDERFRRTDFAPRESSYGQTQQYQFETKDGNTGVVSYRYNPTTKDIYIRWMGSATGSPSGIKPHELGVDKVQEIFKNIAEKHPDAETITAFRVSGARSVVGSGARMMTRRIPRELMTPSSTGSQTTPSNSWGVPGTRLTDLW